MFEYKTVRVYRQFMDRKINELAKQGWELVSTSDISPDEVDFMEAMEAVGQRPEGRITGVEMVFKRDKKA
jgi:hypothetical protein